jgi:hypothetical protein
MQNNELKLVLKDTRLHGLLFWMNRTLPGSYKIVITEETIKRQQCHPGEDDDTRKKVYYVRGVLITSQQTGKSDMKALFMCQVLTCMAIGFRTSPAEARVARV